MWIWQHVVLWLWRFVVLFEVGFGSGVYVHCFLAGCRFRLRRIKGAGRDQDPDRLRSRNFLSGDALHHVLL